ncbi:MAG: hypothetical protein H0T51_22385 [Pirellulales bacterium]|nr:hypothetical protein [Pirellulales bacterium]
MARETHEREDLLRDATALVPRVMLRVQLGGQSLNVFAGFRGESLSLYLGDDPVYHFNDRGELRRAFVDGRLIKAEQGRLVSLERKRGDTETVLERQAGSEQSDRDLLADLSRMIQKLAAEMITGRVDVVGQVPENGDAAARLADWLAQRPKPTIAASPRVG